jgi:glyoxylase-like metal-dependent hydrolase (beta-lactamase superfamily II)
LEKTLARMPQLDPETGVYVEEVKPNLFYVTGGIYQSAFLKTGEGVIVFDAPPSFAHQLPAIIAEHAPDVPITHLVYSHGHTDHVGGASVFGEIEDLQVVAPVKVAASIAEEGAPTILRPTMTYEEQYDLTVGGEKVELKTASFHAEDEDAIIYLPEQKFLIAVDTVTTGEVPFMNFGATADVGEYLTMFDELLAYDFDVLLSGHLSILGTRADVLENKEYAFDVQASVLKGMQTFQQRIGETMAAMEFTNGNLAYRSVIEQMRGECSAEIISKWQDRLSVVDVWADSHCETMIVYSLMH